MDDTPDTSQMRNASAATLPEQPSTGADTTDRSPVVKPVAPADEPRPSPADRLAAEEPERGATGGGVGRFLIGMLRRLATFAIAAAAILIAIVTWQDYVMAPWTRNGSVRVQVANVAPQVSGQIVELHVDDNQFVRQGDVLYVIDPFDFQAAVTTSKAQLAQTAADLELKQVESKRRQHLSDLTTTPEEQQIYASSAAQAQGAFDAAQQGLSVAELNLKRTSVVSPVEGYVTNLLLRVGDFAPTGASNISVIDSSSFWIDGYFEETKMAGICVGDHAEALLMGYSQPIIGHVETVTRGISVSNAAAGSQGLPNVDPIYTWVRLAQRVPVRIAIDHVPEGVPLISGMTATVTIGQQQERSGSLLDWGYAKMATSVSSLLYGPPPSRPGCLPVMASQPAPTEAVPVQKEPPAQSPDKIDPGIAPGLDISPKAE